MWRFIFNLHGNPVLSGAVIILLVFWRNQILFFKPKTLLGTHWWTFESLTKIHSNISEKNGDTDRQTDVSLIVLIQKTSLRKEPNVCVRVHHTINTMECCLFYLKKHLYIWLFSISGEKSIKPGFYTPYNPPVLIIFNLQWAKIFLWREKSSKAQILSWTWAKEDTKLKLSWAH